MYRWIHDYYDIPNVPFWRGFPGGMRLFSRNVPKWPILFKSILFLDQDPLELRGP